MAMPLATLKPTLAMKTDLKPDNSDIEFDKRLEELANAVRRYHQYLVCFANSLLNNWADAECVVSNLYTYVLLHLERKDITCLPVLRRKVYFLCIDFIRSQANKAIPTDEIESFELIADVEQPLTEAEEAAYERKFWDDLGITTLTDIEKRATWLSLRFEYTYEEIATMLPNGVKKSMIGNYVNRGTAAIRKAMS